MDAPHHQAALQDAPAPQVPEPLDSSETSAAPSAAATAAAVVLDKLASVDQARKAERERRREETREAADPRESVACFLNTFTARQRNVENALQRMLQPQDPKQNSVLQTNSNNSLNAPASTVDAASAPTVDSGTATAPLPPLTVSSSTPEQVAASLELLSAEVLTLEQSAAAASYYLPTYDLKQCTATVASLRASIEGARASLAPRRKFAFGSKKVSKVRGQEVSAAASSTAPRRSIATTSSATMGTIHTTPTPLDHPDCTAGHAPPPPPATTLSASNPACSSPRGAAPSYTPPTTLTTTTPSTTAATSPDGGGGGGRGHGDAGGGGGGGSSTADDVAPAALVVSPQDGALIASGRGLMGLTDRTIVLRSGEVSGVSGGGDFVLAGLTRCEVVLVGRLRALRVLGLRGCRVVAGPVTGACFLDDVRGSTMSLATYQVRIHRTQGTDLYLRTRSKPIIEHSSGIRVAPWAAGVAQEPRLDSLLQAHMLGEESNCWQQVDDFGWIKATQSPNWCVMPQTELPTSPTPLPESVWEEGLAQWEGGMGREGAVGGPAGGGEAASLGVEAVKLEEGAGAETGLQNDDEI